MHPTTAFAAPLARPCCSESGFRVCGLDYPFAPSPGRLPSSLYTFPAVGLGSGLPRLTTQASPNLAGYHLEIAPQAALLSRPL